MIIHDIEDEAVAAAATMAKSFSVVKAACSAIEKPRRIKGKLTLTLTLTIPPEVVVL